MTSEGLTDATARHRAIGFSACLAKPLRQSEFFNALVHALDYDGTTARATDPIRERSSAPSLVPVSATPEDDLPSLRILLAEDHPVNQKVAARMLEGMGHVVVVVGDGQRAIGAIDQHPGGFDVVLMDVQMPVMDGFEAIGILRAREAQSWVPVIALTAHAMKGDRERCLAAGFDEYLSKPIRSTDLRDILRRLLGRNPSAKTASCQEEAPTPARGVEPAFFAELVERCAGDEEFARELIASYLESGVRIRSP